MKAPDIDTRDVLYLVGAAALSFGVGSYDPRAGLIALGGVLLATALASLKR